MVGLIDAMKGETPAQAISGRTTEDFKEGSKKTLNPHPWQGHSQAIMSLYRLLSDSGGCIYSIYSVPCLVCVGSGTSGNSTTTPSASKRAFLHRLANAAWRFVLRNRAGSNMAGV